MQLSEDCLSIISSVKYEVAFKIILWKIYFYYTYFDHTLGCISVYDMCHKKKFEKGIFRNPPYPFSLHMCLDFEMRLEYRT